MERVEDLQVGGLRLIQDDEKYTFTSDSCILANYANVKHNETALEIGAGSGVISILLSHKCSPKKIIGVEIQKEMFELFERNIKLNAKEDVIVAVNDDILNYSKLHNEEFDVVFSNPPYKKKGTTFINENEIKAISRHEIFLDLKTLCMASSKALKFGGRLFLTYDANRSVELFCELEKNNLIVKEFFYTYPKECSNACLVVIKAVKGAKHFADVLFPVITNDKDGKYLQTILEWRKK